MDSHASGAPSCAGLCSAVSFRRLGGTPARAPVVPFLAEVQHRCGVSDAGADAGAGLSLR